VQRSFFSRRSFAAAGDKENLDDFVSLAGIGTGYTQHLRRHLNFLQVGKLKGFTHSTLPLSFLLAVLLPRAAKKHHPSHR
jgi:hypothetical protein